MDTFWKTLEINSQNCVISVLWICEFDASKTTAHDLDILKICEKVFEHFKYEEVSSASCLSLTYNPCNSNTQNFNFWAQETEKFNDNFKANVAILSQYKIKQPVKKNDKSY